MIMKLCLWKLEYIFMIKLIIYIFIGLILYIEFVV